MNYQKRIVTEPLGLFRFLARKHMESRGKQAFLYGVIYLLLITLPNTLVRVVTNFNVEAVNQATRISYGLPYSSSKSAQLILIALIIFGLFVSISGPLSLGIQNIYLRFRRGQNVDISLLFSGFENFGRAFLLCLLTTVFIVLWAMVSYLPGSILLGLLGFDSIQTGNAVLNQLLDVLLFLVLTFAGMIAAYRYYFAYLILADNPKMKVMDAIRISKILTKGNKKRLFLLDLSFLGWMLLSFVALFIVMFVILILFVIPFVDFGQATTNAIEIVLAISEALCAGLVIFYRGVAITVFYETAGGIGVPMPTTVHTNSDPSICEPQNLPLPIQEQGQLQENPNTEEPVTTLPEVAQSPTELPPLQENPNTEEPQTPQ
ncbi:MAG: DUF975 family protein [Clostridiales Family XIII bacterium]|jgi:uncharacterized membrane protein|nr:DUF975 family protein [Clostridiales Family XIII bacterium]